MSVPRITQQLIGQLSWPTAIGIALSACGIVVTVGLYVRGNRSRQEDISDEERAQLGIGADASASFRNAALSINLRTDGSVSRRRRLSRRTEADTLLAEILPFDQEEEVVAELEAFQRQYTLHEVSQYYAAMTEEDLRPEPDDDSDVA